MNWELSTDAGSNWVTFASLNLNHAVRQLRAFDLDQFTFRGPAALALTADLPSGFSYASTIVIRKNDGATNPLWFTGRMGTAPRIGTGADESIQYTLDGPWWYLQHCMYQQSWKVYSSGTGGLVNTNKARVILCQSSTNTRLDSGAQITDAIDWAIARGAPITKGTIDTGTTLPFDERINISCAEVIQTMLRYTPDVIPWFDYSTSPPTFHCRKRANLTAVSKAITALSAINPITPRSDLQVPGVTIIYERLNDWGDGTFQTVFEDTAGTTNLVDSVFASFELQGSTATYLTQAITVAAFPKPGGSYNWNDKTWWKSLVPELQKIKDADLTIEEGARTAVAGAAWDSYLVKGTIHDWMSCDGEEQSITAKVSGIIRDESNVEVKVLFRVTVTIKLIGTNGTSKTYKKLASLDVGEDTPTGVAAALYASWNTLHYEGAARTVETEVAGTLVPGSKLNLTSGRTEWASMASMIVETEEDIDNGTTTCRFGPPARIEADSLVALLRALRGRQPSFNFLSRSTGEAGGQNSVELSGYVRYESSSGLEGETSAALMRETDGDSHVQALNLKPSAITFADAGDKAALTLQPREILVPDDIATPTGFKRVQVLCSAPYHATIPGIGGGNPYSFQFTKTSTTGGTLCHGKVIVKGVPLTCSGWTNHATGADLAITGITATTYFYWLIDLAAATAAWTTNTTGFPAPTSTVYPYPILTLTCAASIITAVKEHRDAHLPGNV